MSAKSEREYQGWEIHITGEPVGSSSVPFTPATPFPEWF
jgi:hypothetical protein